MIKAALTTMRSTQAAFMCPEVAFKSVMSIGAIRHDRRVLRSPGNVTGYDRNNPGSGVT
jgi:hypothetical protein